MCARPPRRVRTPSPEQAETHTQQAAGYSLLIAAINEQKQLRADWADEKTTAEERVSKTASLVGFKKPCYK